MVISFNEAPNNTRTKQTYVEFDSTSALKGLTKQPYKLLAIGQKLSAGTQAALTPISVTSIAQAKTLFGDGSQLHDMAKSIFKTSDYVNVEFVAFADPGSGAKATGTIAVTGPSTAAGTISLYIGGDLVEVAVASGASAATVATAIAAAIVAKTELIITAEVDGSVNTQVNLENKHKGVWGNDVDVRVNYASGQELPAGIGLTITGFASGSGSPDYSTLWAVIPNTHYNVMIIPTDDSTVLTSVKTELTDRMSATRQQDVLAVVVKNGSVGTLQSLGNAHNNKSLIVASAGASPRAPWRQAASLGKTIVLEATKDPARHYFSVIGNDILAPVGVNNFDRSERNTLLFDGVAPLFIDADSVARIDRLITTYKTNAAGADDEAYMDVTTLTTLSYLRYDLRTLIDTKYPRSKLADDGTIVASSANVVTPSLIKAEIVARYKEWEAAGLVEKTDEFKESLVVERNVSDVSRLDVEMRPNLINGLIISAFKISFQL